MIRPDRYLPRACCFLNRIWMWIKITRGWLSKLRPDFLCCTREIFVISRCCHDWRLLVRSVCTGEEICCRLPLCVPPILQLSMFIKCGGVSTASHNLSNLWSLICLWFYIISHIIKIHQVFRSRLLNSPLFIISSKHLWDHFYAITRHSI